jgi:ParB family chromosome partitioning protein
MKIYNKIQKIDAVYIEPDLDQPRKTFRRETLVELAESIKQSDLINPILVEKVNGKYKIVVGHRRTRAARLAGMTRIRALEISTLSEDERLELQIAEDSQEPFSPDERAEAWKRLYESEKRKADKNGKKFTMNDFCKKVGKSQSTVRKAFSFLMLDERVKSLVREQILKYGVGVELSYLSNRPAQYWVALQAAIGDYTAKRTQQLVRQDIESEKYIWPKKFKRQLAKATMDITLREIIGRLNLVLEGKNDIVTKDAVLLDCDVAKKIYGWRLLIRKTFDLKKAALKLEQEFKL